MTARAVATRMAQCCRQLAARGLIAGQDGNLSVRLERDRALVTPSGAIKGLVQPGDMVEVDLQGRKRRGRGNPTSELDLHLRILNRRPDVGAVVHAHPPVATAFGVAGEGLRILVLPELTQLCGEVPLVPYGTPGTPELADRLEPHLAGHDAWLLANHGAVTVGPTLDVAWIRMESLEHAARIIFAARALGRVNELSPEAVARLRRERDD
ncbi:MAG: class II aldolase family protein [Gemmatimonadetes bacterium]|nr:MAG: class II aldolase family protein [Gemmatimonadota bacterium]PYP95741.1 MAG: class II aldolase family protein [Gemmatimonadota bacterium]